MRASTWSALLLAATGAILAAGPGSLCAHASLEPPPGAWQVLAAGPGDLRAVGLSEIVVSAAKRSGGVPSDPALAAWLSDWLPLREGEGLAEIEIREWSGKRAGLYRRLRAGVPVGEDRAIVTLGPEGRACALSVRWTPCGEPAMTEFPAFGPAVAAAEAFLAAAGVTDRRDLGPLWQPGREEEVPPLLPCRQVEVACSQPRGRWRLVVGPSGEILSCRDRLRHEQVPGRIRVLADAPSWCDGRLRFPAQGLQVSGGGVTVVTDATGAFALPVGSDGSVGMTARLRGPQLLVDLYGSTADALLAATLKAGEVATLEWNDLNSRADERDAWHHAGRARSFLAALAPGWAVLEAPLTAHVGRVDAYCPGDAWYEFGTLNFCSAASGFANTATVGSIVAHEFAHAITDRLYGPFDPPVDVDEGNSDFFANLVFDDSRIGLGFYIWNCALPIRDSDNDLSYPEDWTGHDHESGSILAGFHWSVRDELAADLGQEAGAALAADLWLGSRLLGLPMSLPEQVEWTFVADDTDGDLTNGTPHWQALRDAAADHGFPAPPVTWGIEILHEPLASAGTTVLGREVRAEIRATRAPLDPASPRLHYRIGAVWQELPLGPAGDGSYVATLPSESCARETSYYLSAADVEGHRVTLPAEAPAAVYGFLSLGDVVAFADDFEIDRGWTVGAPGDGATSGRWERAAPLLVVGSGVISQPGTERTPDPGRLCFVTGALVGSGPGSNDVDGGATSLVSPRLDLSGLSQAWVCFDAWVFSGLNTTVPELLRLYASADDGATWTLAWSLASLGGWQRHTVSLGGLALTSGMRLKFVIQDPYPPALVEALVDEVAIQGCALPPPPPPLCGLLSPRAGARLPIGSSVTISWRYDGQSPPVDYGLLLSRDGGVSWPDTLRWQQPWDDRWVWPVTGPATGTAVLRLMVRDEIGAQAAASVDRLVLLGIALAQPDAPRVFGPWPNPSNPSTSLHFGLPRPAMVRLRILDAAGRVVATLHDGPLPAGEHAFRWEGRDASGRGAPAGIYLAAVEVDGRREVRKIALVK